MSQNKIVTELRNEWKMLWRDRFDDKIRAEGIADREYSMLFIEKGTVIFATRDFKPLDLRHIVERHELANIDRIIPPSPSVGGWGKFIKTSITDRKPFSRTKRKAHYSADEKEKQQLKKGGRGWLHT